MDATISHNHILPADYELCEGVVWRPLDLRTIERYACGVPVLPGRRYITNVSLIIRTAGSDDLARVQTVYRRSSLSNEGDRDALLHNPEYLVLPDEGLLEGRMRVAEHPNIGIVGFATIERQSSTAELVDLFVDPDSMRQGVARALITDAVATLAADGIRALEVTANTHALAFYAEMGFEVVGAVTTPLGSGVRMRLRCGAEGEESRSTFHPTCSAAKAPIAVPEEALDVKSLRRSRSPFWLALPKLAVVSGRAGTTAGEYLIVSGWEGRSRPARQGRP